LLNHYSGYVSILLQLITKPGKKLLWKLSNRLSFFYNVQRQPAMLGYSFQTDFEKQSKERQAAAHKNRLLPTIDGRSHNSSSFLMNIS